MLPHQEQLGRKIADYLLANADKDVVEWIETRARAAAELLQRLIASLQESFERLSPQFAEALASAERYWADQPASAGLEPLLVSKGHHPLVARFYAHTLANLWRRIAAAQQLEGEVILEIRRIAKARYRGAACRRAAPVLLSPGIDELQERIFERHGVRLEDFQQQFGLAVEGNQEAQSRVVEMASALAPHLKASPGRKPSPASVAREYIEQFPVLFAEFAKYKYDPVVEDFVDPITLALRKEFGEPRFAPRAACRRASKRTMIA